MKKRIVVAALTAVMALSMFTGCGSTSGSETKKEYDDKTQEILEDTPFGEADEYFIWEGESRIIGLTEVGAKLKEVVIPERCEVMSSGIFVDANSQAEVVTFESEKDVDIKSAFEGFKTLKKIVLPAETDNIPYKAFCECENLEEIVLPEKLVTIGNQAFEGCVSLKEITLPDSVETVGDKAFYDASSLTCVRLSKNMKTMGYNIFPNGSMEEIYIPAEMELEEYYDSTFVTDRFIKIYVTAGSWADTHFEEFAENNEKVVQ